MNEPSIVERVARAIFTLRHSTPEQQAIAAIKAMREPTEAMIKAGNMARMNIQGGYGGPGSWASMIDAALNEGKEGE